LKERRLGSLETQLLEKERQLKSAKEAIDAANLNNDEKIGVIEARVLKKKVRE
jgi:hypothetical protein